MKQNKTKLERIDTFMNGWQLAILLILYSVVGIALILVMVYLFYNMIRMEPSEMRVMYNLYGLIICAIGIMPVYIGKKIATAYMESALNESIDNTSAHSPELIKKFKIKELKETIKNAPENRKSIIEMSASTALNKLWNEPGNQNETE